MTATATKDLGVNKYIDTDNIHSPFPSPPRALAV